NVEALAREAGTPITAWGVTAHTFPSPRAVAAAGEARLRALGLGFRAKNLAGTARMVAAGDVQLDALAALPYLAARQELLRLPGVGPKIADCVLAFSLDHGEAFPVDRWVLRALEQRYFNGARMNEEKAAAWARERFGR